jgi:benzylsuccinate CoA-transferase BbsF subunit
MKKQALEGLKVADFSWVITGPLSSKLLGDCGATVVRVENSDRPDTIRLYTPYKDGVPGLNRSGFFSVFNSSKYSINLNLGDRRGIDVANRLVAWADVVVENFTPGVMARLGLAYDDLVKIKPDIIMVSAAMQGQTGPHRMHPGFGLMLQALAGFAHVTGWPEGEPHSPLTYIDFIGPWYVVVAVLAALDYRNRTGKGQYVDLSQLEAGIQFLAPAVLDYVVNGRVQGRMGNRSSSSAPHGVYRCQGSERWCAIAVSTDEEWQSFCKVIGQPELTREPRFATLLARLENVDELDRLVEQWTINHSPEEVMVMMQEAGVPAAVVANSEDLHLDPQLKHREHFRVLNHSEIGPHSYDSPSFRLSKTPVDLRMSAPCLGEHNEYVCTKILGMSDDELLELLQSGVLK